MWGKSVEMVGSAIDERRRGTASKNRRCRRSIAENFNERDIRHCCTIRISRLLVRARSAVSPTCCCGSRTRGINALGIFANAPDARHCSPVALSRLPKSSSLTQGMAGDEARAGTAQSGRVSEAQYRPPLLRGSYVREGAKAMRSGLRIKSAIDVENVRMLGVSLSAGKIWRTRWRSVWVISEPTADALVRLLIEPAIQKPAIIHCSL